MESAFRLVELAQGSEAWKAWRQRHHTASEAAIIMGDPASYWETKTWDALRLVKVGMAPEPSEYAKRLYRSGHVGEGRIRARVESELGRAFPPVCVEAAEGCGGAFDLGLAASLDGFDVYSNEWLEIKYCASGERATLWRSMCPEQGEAVLPRHLHWQLVHQALVLNNPDALCRLVVGVDVMVGEDEPELRTVVHAVRAGDLLADAEALLTRWAAFDGGEAQCGSARAQAAFSYRASKDAEKAAKTEVDDAKSVLLQFPDGSADGVNVTTQTRSGKVNWEGVADALWETNEPLRTKLEASGGGITTLGELADAHRAATSKVRAITLSKQAH